MKNRPRILIVSELYYPEKVSTGYFLTGIAEALAQDFDVKVICAQPTYASRGTRAPRHETRNDVEISRYYTTVFNNSNIFLKAVNMATIGLSFSLGVLWNARRKDIVISVTNPPVLTILLSLVRFARGFRHVLIVHDVYPECLHVAGLLSRKSFLFRVLSAVFDASYRCTDSVVVIGVDMHILVRRKIGNKSKQVVTIPNWGDTDAIRPQGKIGNELIESLGLQDKFIVLHYGSVGRTHDFDCLIEAAEISQNDESVHFLFSGFGSQFSKSFLKNGNSKSDNVTFLPRVNEEKLSELLNACDVAVVSFKPQSSGVSVPSRMYNILAAGKPIMALVDDDSEVARVLSEHNIGWVLRPGRADFLVRLIRDVKSDPQGLVEMGARARGVAERFYSADVVQAKYRDYFAHFFEASNDRA